MSKKRDDTSELFGWNGPEDEFMDYLIASGEIDQHSDEKSELQYARNKKKTSIPCTTQPSSIGYNIFVVIGAVFIIAIIVLLLSFFF